MQIIKFTLLFALISVLVYGFTDFTGKESIAITALGFGFSAVMASFAGVMIILLVALFLFSSSSISIYPKMLFMEGILFCCWEFTFNFIIPDGKLLTLLGINIYNLGNYFIYGVSVLIGIGIVMMMFPRINDGISQVKKNG